MAFLSKGKKIDLYNLASELRVSVTLEDKIIDLREKITSCTFFQNNEQFVKEMLDNIVDERKSLEIEALKKIEREDKFLADQRAFELEKLKLQAQNPPASVGNSSQMDSNPMRLDLKTVLPTFIPDKDDISLFLAMFERQMKLLNVPADFWVSHLIGVLPSDIGSDPGPEYRDEEICELKTIIIDFPTRTANELRTEKLKDLELKKIVDCFENPNKGVDFANWTGRGYVMNQGVLYRYSPHAEVEAQLVVPTHEREKILKLHHDAPTAAHYGADGTFYRISSKYYWTGMRKFIADYVKSCSECIRYKATNQKPAGLLQTPVPAQRFESIAIDLFGPLPETTEGMKWIFIVEDYTTKWVELFPLKQATAKECAMTLLNEVFLRDTECPGD
ncbi:transposon Tf2-9 polyprotein [Trichonephila clavipes]|nr:transposon Tf2-9 polyprotein [Trichonephila clavipes]